MDYGMVESMHVANVAKSPGEEAVSGLLAATSHVFSSDWALTMTFISPSATGAPTFYYVPESKEMNQEICIVFS